MISFNSIPADLRTPGSFVEFDSSKANPGLPAKSSRVLLLGQKLAAGTVANGVMTRITSAQQAQVAFGRGSMLHRMAQAFKVANGVNEVWALSLADLGGGVAAIGSATFNAVPTAAGVVPLYIGGQRLRLGVTADQSVASMATALGALINANTDLPVTATVAAGVVTLTARWKGATGNDIDLRTVYYADDVLPAGLGLAISPMANGAGNPDVATAIAALGDNQFEAIVLPWTDASNLDALGDELADRWGPVRQIEGVAYACVRGSQGALATVGHLPNSQLVVLGEANGPTPTYERAAAMAGVAVYYGDIDPARPFQTLALPGVLAPLETERFTRGERDLLLHDGISTFTVSAGAVLMERLITTYRTNAAGLSDTAYLDLNTVLTVAYLRWSLRVRFAAKFGRMKLADDGIAVAPGQAIVTPATLKAELVALAKDWEAAGLVQDVDTFKANLIVERDSGNPSRVNALIPPQIVGGLRIFAAQIQFQL